MGQEITSQYIKTALAELKESQRETSKQIRDTGMLIKETELQIEDTGIQIKETDKWINEVINLFITEHDKLIESLSYNEIVKMFNKIGITILRTSNRIKGKYEGTNYEFDIIAHNGDEIVVIEIKTTLKVEDVKKHIKHLNKIKTWMSEYKNHKIIGAVAYLRADEESDTFAESKGLYVIRATGNSASIINGANFEPSVF